MACPTCGHTLQGIGKTEDGRRHFWCRRCGTIRGEAGNHADTEAPAIVDRLREFHGMISSSPEGRVLRSLAEQSGITESILRPENRAAGRPDR
jgi:tRNA(Ile2) C34 agmatinyltransferase TiaS